MYIFHELQRLFEEGSRCGNYSKSLSATTTAQEQICDADEAERATCSVQEPWPQWDPRATDKETVFPWDYPVLEETDDEKETDFAQTFHILKTE